ncbi:hypothetical protein MRB53_041500 [Persea americana]|nr:hypothetical protein MRB53_041500 [Persea americana]
MQNDRLSWMTNCFQTVQRLSDSETLARVTIPGVLGSSLVKRQGMREESERPRRARVGSGTWPPEFLQHSSKTLACVRHSVNTLSAHQ